MAQVVKKETNKGKNELVASSSLNELIATKEIQDTITQTLGKARVQTFIGSALTVAQDPKLKDVEPNSLFNCLLKSATYNFPIDSNLGYAYPVPYKNEDGIKIAQFQMGTKGIIELAYRTNKYKRLNVKEVRQGEITGYDFFGEVQIKWAMNNREKLPVVGYMAAFELTNGMTKRVFWSVEDIKEHANKYSKAHQYALKSKNTSEDVWTKNFNAMAQKTVLKDLLKYAPKSVELQNALQFDQAVIQRKNGVETPIYVDSDNVGGEEIDPNKVYDIDENNGGEEIVINDTNSTQSAEVEDDEDILYIDYKTEYVPNKDIYERAIYPDGRDPYDKTTKKIRVRKKQ